MDVRFVEDRKQMNDDNFFFAKSSKQPTCLHKSLVLPMNNAFHETEAYTKPTLCLHKSTFWLLIRLCRLM